MKRNGIFIPGWEFNRILADDPTEERQSALPGDLLWNGSAPLWLFENVYCSAASLKGEQAALNDLGWASGYAFDDLASEKRGILRPFDWKALEDSEEILEKVKNIHKQLSSEHDEVGLRSIIESGKPIEIEAINQMLIEPILDHLNCVGNVSPSTTRKWFEETNKDRKVDYVSEAIKLIVDPLHSGKINDLRADYTLCEPPSRSISQAELKAQESEERNVQKPLISDLMIGTLEQGEYHALIKKGNISAYLPLNRSIKDFYDKNIENLMRLRDLAAKYIWDDFHNHWLPQLEEDATFLEELGSLINRSLRKWQFDDLLGETSTIRIGQVVSDRRYAVAGEQTPSRPRSVSSIETEEYRQGRESEAVQKLSLFYQHAQRGTVEIPSQGHLT